VSRFVADSPLERVGFEPSVPPALGYSLLIMKSLAAEDSAPQTSPFATSKLPHAGVAVG